MNDTKIDPYIFFNGNCREAMEFYKSVFGGELHIMNMGDAPGTSPEDKDKVMHALLDGEVRIMASDSSQASPKTAKIELCVGGSDETKLKKFFEDLSAGATVKTPLRKEFWGDTFGQLTDKYSVDWMFNIAGPKTDGQPTQSQ